MKTFKFGVKHIVLSVLAVILAVAMGISNYFLKFYSPILHMFFAGDTTDYGTEQAEAALALGDELVQEVAEESMVLLRNENGALPLKVNDKVNLFGYSATDNGFILTGGGSGGANVAPDNKVTLTQAFEREGMEYNTELLARYAALSSEDLDANIAVGSMYQRFAVFPNPGAEFYSEEVMASAHAYSDVAVVVLGRYAGENGGTQGELFNPKNSSYTNGTILGLTSAEQAMMDAVKRYFGGDQGKIIVLFNTCNNMETGFLVDYDVDAALYVGVPGQSGALAIPRLLRGQTVEKSSDGKESVRYVTPSGKLSDTLRYRYSNAGNGWDGFYTDPYTATWISLLPQSEGNGFAYTDGIYVGYKWYETAAAEGFFDEVVTPYGSGYDGIVQYPFGYGLSYTQFKWTVLETPDSDLLTANGSYRIKVRVENTGTRPGQDVVELYYTPPYENGGIEKASVNLLAFAKTDVIAPGEAEEVTLSFQAYDMASFDDYDKNGNYFVGYELDAGTYDLKLMNNAHDLAENCYTAEGEIGGNVFEMVCNGIEFVRDPVTGEAVTTRLTGDRAYGGYPVDGSNSYSKHAEKIVYLSRADGFSNFKNLSRVGGSWYGNNAKNASVNKGYLNPAYNGQDTSDIRYGVDAGMFLATDEKGNRLSLAALNGTDQSVTLKPNIELMLKLADYDNDEVWNPFLNQITEAETKTLIGAGGFQTAAIESLGKQLCIDRDGPSGFNLGVAATNTETRWTLFPAEALIGCSWSQKMTFSIGRAQGAIANATGLKGWYGPGLNLHRSIYYTRNFEYYSEDALLTGKLAAETVRGAKQNNTYCYIKHFVASELGGNPNDVPTYLTEQNLRETYMRPFEIAVKEGGANAVMTALNRVGGELWSGFNGAICTDILRGEWGFRGTVISDYWQYDYMEINGAVLGGNDLALDASAQAAATNLNLSDNAVKYAARQSVKNIIYTYVDSYVTAYKFQQSGAVDDKYQVTVDVITVRPGEHSSLFIFLWVLVDVVMGAGIVLCVVFCFLSPRKHGRVEQTQKREQEGASSDGGIGTP